MKQRTAYSIQLLLALLGLGTWAPNLQAALPVIHSFSSSRSSVGNFPPWNPVYLNWSVAGATQLSLDQGLGDVTGLSSKGVSPVQTTRYTLTASNAEGSVSASLVLPATLLKQINANLYQTEHALFYIPDASQVTWPDWNSVYAFANLDAYKALLQSVAPDDYFMVVVLAANLTPNKVPNVLTYRHHADGIGQQNIVGVGVPNICRYHIGNGTVGDSALAVFDHEIGHNWGVQIGIELASGHWFSNNTVHGQMADVYSDDNYTTIKSIVGDTSQGFSWQAQNNLQRNETELYSAQDLYAMGLNEVFPDTYALSNPVYNPDGSMSYSAVQKYDHAWAVTKNGPRVPSYADSAKQMRLGFIYIARDFNEIQNVFYPVERSITQFENAEQIDTVKYRFQVPFLVATQYRASVSARLGDLDGNSAPSLSWASPSYQISSNGNAVFAFNASDADGPSPKVSVLPAMAEASVQAGNVSFQGLSVGTHFFTLKAEDALGKKAFVHGVIDVVNPNVYNFTAQTGVVPGASVTSQALIIQGIAPGTPIAVRGGRYAINQGPWQTVSGLINPGDSLTLQHDAASQYHSSQSQWIVLGHNSGNFSSTTMPALSQLDVSAGSLQPSFSGTQFNYQLAVGPTVSQISLTPSTADSAASVQVQNQTLLSGQASAPIALNVGNNNVLVQVQHLGGSAQQSYTLQVIRAASPSVLLSSNTSSAVWGQNLTLTAQIQGGQAPYGSVDFMDGAQLLGQVAVDAQGMAQLSLNSLPGGNHNLSAHYSGNVWNAGSDSGPWPQHISMQPSLSLQSTAPAQPMVGQNLRVQTQLTWNGNSNVAPTGLITISDGVQSCSVNLPATTCGLPLIQPGIAQIQASYSGDAHFASSTSGVTGINIQPDPNDSDGDGMPNAVESSEGRNASLKDNDLFGSASLNHRWMVMQQYRDFLFREGPNNGLNYWTLQMDQGLPAATMIQNFMQSAPAQASIRPLARLFIAMFGDLFPSANINGFVFYARAVANGSLSLDGARNQLLASATWANLYGNMDDSQFAQLILSHVQGSAPSPAQIHAAVTAISTSSRSAWLQQQVDQPSFISSIEPNLFVQWVFLSMGRKTPAAQASLYWLNQIKADPLNGKTAMINAFLGSAQTMGKAAVDYRHRFLP